MLLLDRLIGHLQRAWLHRGLTAWALSPLSLVYGALVSLRRLAFSHGLIQIQKLPVPVLVVGNRIAGGAGKTPTTLALLEHLKKLGWQPGVLTRGHGARPAPKTPLMLDATTAHALDAIRTGDEPWLIWRLSQVPLMICADRAAGGRALLSHHREVNILVCDDGLQHLGLHRDIEVIVFDERGVGNGWLLPAGPLREPVNTVAVTPLVAPPIVLHNTGARNATAAGHVAHRAIGPIVKLQAWWDKRSSTEKPPRKVHAMAGIANPDRFFHSLSEMGLDVTPCPLRDHAQFNVLPWALDVRDLVVTEKDAVKLDPTRVAVDRPGTQVWVATLDFRPEPSFWKEIDLALERLPTPAASVKHPNCH